MNKVAEKIIADAEAGAAQIRQKGMEDEAALREEYRLNRLHITERQELELKSTYEEEMDRILARHRIDHGKKLLEAKNELIRLLMEQLRKTILGDRTRYTRFLEEMALRGALSGKEEILVRKDDREIVDDTFLKRLNARVLERTGNESALRLSGDNLEARGGLLLREGRQEFNAAIDIVIARLLDDHIVDIARMLFGDGEGREA